MKNKLIIGRYLPTQSLIHELDPRAKLIFVFYLLLRYSLLTRLLRLHSCYLLF